MKSIVRLIDSTKQDIRKILTELIALWFSLKDRRIRWHTKIIVIIPVIYIIFPINLIPDAVIFLGQLDDLIVIRISYVILKKMIAAEVLEECREQAQVFMSERHDRRFKFAFALSVIWITVVTLLALYIIKKARKHSLPLP
jgi:uncharacterized membrane protein YkvA (DUF1232 family)